MQLTVDRTLARRLRDARLARYARGDLLRGEMDELVDGILQELQRPRRRGVRGKRSAGRTG